MKWKSWKDRLRTSWELVSTTTGLKTAKDRAKTALNWSMSVWSNLLLISKFGRPVSVSVHTSLGQNQTSKHYNLQQQIINASELDADATKVLTALLGGGSTTFWNDLAEWTTEDFDGKKVLFYKGKNYIPKDLPLRQDILKTFHDHEMVGHPRELETYNVVRQHYWWPRLHLFVKTYAQDVGSASSLKLTEIHPNQPFFL